MFEIRYISKETLGEIAALRLADLVNGVNLFSIKLRQQFNNMLKCTLQIYKIDII